MYGRGLGIPIGSCWIDNEFIYSANFCLKCCIFQFFTEKVLCYYDFTISGTFNFVLEKDKHFPNFVKGRYQ